MPVIEIDVDHLPKQLTCSAGCGRTLHYFVRIGTKGAVYVCSCCGQERTA